MWETCGRHVGDISEISVRYEGDMRKKWERFVGEEMCGKCVGNVWEIWGRYGGDMWEIWYG
jgi:hypothetical protein